MKRWRLAIGLVASIVLGAATTSGATVPGQVDFQGLLLDSEGEPATGTVDLVFALYDAPMDGSLLWTETLLDVPLVDGSTA